MKNTYTEQFFLYKYSCQSICTAPGKFRWAAFGLLALTVLDLELFNKKMRKRGKGRKEDRKEETVK